MPRVFMLLQPPSRPDAVGASRRTRIATATVVALLAALVPATAAAHLGATDLDSPWQRWNLAPDMLVGTLLALALWTTGTRRQRGALSAWRHVSFVSGLAILVLALVSPLDAVAEHLFLAHQVQHLLLRMVGPMLMMLAAPHGVFFAGLPGALRRHVAAPVTRLAGPLGVLSPLTHPAIVTALFLGSLYLWQVPALHNAALLDEPTHYLMHLTMLGAGLLFWGLVFDPRRPPAGPRYGARLMMLWMTAFGTIIIGAWMSLKDTVLYDAYATLGRLGSMSALEDERLGGLIVWIPGTMMSIVGVLVVISRWGRHEARMELAARRPATPTAAEQRRRNATLALGLCGVALAVFAILIGVAMISLGSRGG